VITRNRTGRRRGRRDATSGSRHVLAVVREAEHALVIRAAFHLIDLDVRQADSAAEATVELCADPPLLVVVADDPTRPGDLVALGRGAAETGVPVVRLTDEGAAGPSTGYTTVRSPFGPLELLGAAQMAAPDLYEHPTGGSVEPTTDDQLVLLTHDLRRAVEDERRRRDERDDARLGTALGLVGTLALRDIETAQHSYRVRAYARALALCVDPLILDDLTVELGFLLHDVGKLALPDQILQKPGQLNAAELATMRTHPRLGAEIVSGILPAGQALAVVRSHHERWDGRGYPDGLRGEAIPLAARIFAVADTLDAISSNRPYRQARTWAEAVQIVRTESGAQFDPRVVEALNRTQ
jgi:HD-GYP domain-containing protein (c-di-GMP phosphodiesterase class II)